MITYYLKLIYLFDETNKKIYKFRNILIFLFFSIIFIIGFSLVKDYGATNDEYNQRLNGFITLNYLGEKFIPKITKEFRGDKEFPKFENVPDNLRYYGGSIIHTPLAFLEIIFDIKDKKNIFLFKHYSYFIIFFLSLISFFNICKHRFLNWKYGILGVLILFISPRIFANSIYNNLDIPFMSFMIFSLNYGLSLLKKISFKNIIFFSFFSGIAIDIRLMGMIMPCTIIFILFLDTIIKTKNYKNFFTSSFYITILTFLFIIIMWPMLWEDPIKNLINVFNNLANHPIKGYNFYLGSLIPFSETPWHYLLIWILATTPLIYSLIFFIGIIRFIFNVFNKKIDLFLKDLTFILIFFCPILAIIFLSSTLYNGWRHVYFIYPYFVIIGLIGIEWILKILKNKKFYYLIQFIILFSLFNTSYWMVKNHPHHYVFFNRFVATNANKFFELDYMAVSYKTNLDYLENTEKRDKYYIYNSSETKLWYPLFSLNYETRLKFIESKKENAEYWITNYHFDKETYDDDFYKRYELLNEVVVDGNKINSLFKLKIIKNN